MPDADDEPVREPTPVEQPPPPKPAELKEEVTVQGGRRRGKRQVMKKVQMKDEEGYLGKLNHLQSDDYVLITPGSYSRRGDLGIVL